MKTRAFTRRPVAQAITLVLGSTVLGSVAIAQEANQGSAQSLDEIVVTGIRGSLISSMNLKREAQGVVDGIVAEDIGKFPDTNLAESLQRITGVSIDRSIGEGSKITVRGIGPDYNLVLLNGRQMPGATIGDTFASNSRSFDFANLASEAIAGVEVYKTSRASTSTGGIGASVNIKTTRPLDAPGTRMSFGLKGVMDQSADNLPSNTQGDSVTPELSGIYSQTSDDGMWGIALTASYQERAAGYNQASVGNGWRPFGADQGGWGAIPPDPNPNIINRPSGDDIYSVPQNLGYGFNSIERKRTNGQATFQFKPTDALTATLDYTYSENKVHTRRNELSVWFNFGASASSWTDGPVAAPLQYSEIYTFNDDPNTPFVVEGGSDVSMGGADYATKNVNNSVGFNLAWEATEKLGLELDHHSSTATSGADSPFGSNAVLGVASLIRGTTTADFSKDFPVISIVLPADYNGQLRPSMNQVTGSSFRNSYTKAEIEQTQLKGKFELNDASRLDFGVGLTEVNNRSAFANVQSDTTWGGIPGITPDLYPDDVWQLNSVRGFFDNVSGSGNPNLFNQFFSFNFRDVVDLVAPARAALANDLDAMCPLNGSLANLVPCYEASDRWGTDRRTKEESTSAYVQYSHSWEGGVPIHMALGVRYEQTDVTSSALVPIALAVSWTGNNEFPVQFGPPDFTTLEGDYSYVLPSADFAFDLRDNLKLRASVGKSIGRPGWGDIQGGQTLSNLARIDGGSGSQGNPDLKPLESLNYDLSVEWYYGDASYASVGYFRKDIDNYIGVTTVEETPFNLPHPGPGAGYYEEAEANCPGTGDLSCIRAYILVNHDGDPGVVRGLDANGVPTGSITGIPGDPIATFDITVPANQRSAEVDGFEFAVQHMFGGSGFGVSANATIVNSNLSYDNHSTQDQFAIEGLSDSANFIAFFERDKWSVRAAYNWRDEFLAGRFDGTGGPNPVYVEAYGQVDLNASFSPTDSLTFSVEAINLTDEIQRVHGRADRQALFVTQTGTRFMLGARYKFQ
jgi:TonB-dependent receptor